MSGLILKNRSLSNSGEYLPSVYIDKIYLKDNGIAVDTSVFISHSNIKLEDIESKVVEDKDEYIKNLNEHIHHYVAVIIGLTSTDYESYYSGQNLYELITKGDVNVWDLSAYYNESEDLLQPFSGDISDPGDPHPTKVVMFEIDPYSADPLIIFDNNGQEYLKYVDNTTVAIDTTAWNSWDQIVSLQVIAFSSTIENNLSSEDIIVEMSDPILLQKKIGDISYETVWENNTLAARLQVEYVDTDDAIYDQIPLQSLDALFYKIDRITNLEVVANIESLIEEYTEAYKLNEIEDNKRRALRNAINSISVVLQGRGDKADIVPQLNAVRSLFVEKSLAMPVGKFYKQLRRRLFNMDKLIRLAEKVHKKVMYNGKLVDDRAIEILTDIDGSYGDLEDCDFLYADWITTTSHLYDWTGSDLDWTRTVANGYYFFDYEKSLRTDSILSRYIDINRLEAAGIHVPYSHYRVDNSTINRLWGSPYIYVTLKATMYSTVNYPVTEKMLVEDQGTDDANTINPNNSGTPYVEALSCTLLNGTWSHLMNRRFVDVSVNSIDKLSGIDNYRLMCFELMDFASSDSSFNSTYYTNKVELQDSTMLFFAELEGIINWVIDTYGEYLTRCQQLCSANNTTHLFNAFFAESVMEEYKDNMSYAPWIRCPLALLSLQNFITGQYGEKEAIIERAAIIVSQINPVNGNLISVEQFNNDIIAVQELLTGIKSQATIDGYANVTDEDTISDVWYDVEGTKTYSCELSIKDNSEYNDENGVYPIETSGCGEGLGIDLGSALEATGGTPGDQSGRPGVPDVSSPDSENGGTGENNELGDYDGAVTDYHPADTNEDGNVSQDEYNLWYFSEYGDSPSQADWIDFNLEYNY